MKVRELIAALQQFDGELPVAIDSSYGEYAEDDNQVLIFCPVWIDNKRVDGVLISSDDELVKRTWSLTRIISPASSSPACFSSGCH